jgi:tetratricopeptide (TPR) repeat protein
MLGNAQDYAQARAYLEESLEIYRTMGWELGVAYRLENLGWQAGRFGDYAAARVWFTEALSILHRLDKPEDASYTMSLIGELALREGNYQQAQAYLEERLSLLHETGDNDIWLLAHLGYAVLRQGDYARARSLFTEVQQAFKEAQSRIGVVYTVEGMASLSVAQGQPKPATRLFAWANAMRETIGDTRPPIEQADVDRDLATIHTQLDDAAFAEAQTSGRAMSMDEALALALQSVHD